MSFYTSLDPSYSIEDCKKSYIVKRKDEVNEIDQFRSSIDQRVKDDDVIVGKTTLEEIERFGMARRGITSQQSTRSKN